MKRILLVCGAGMSTSLLVKKMEEADEKQDYVIHCCDTVSAKLAMLDHDIFLLAPHVAYMKSEFLPLCESHHIPFLVIETLDYTKMDGLSILKKVNQVFSDFEKENPFHIALLHSHAGAMSDLLLLDMNKKKRLDEKTWVIESIVIDYFIDDGTYHILLLEPQIRFEERGLRKRMKNQTMIIDVAPMSIYASFNGRKMLDYIHQVCEEKIENEKIKMKEGLEKL